METTYKLGSLFDGSGGFPLAGSLCGITPVWAAEIEPYPIAVTRSRFPNMKHLGDISKVNGAEVEPVDIITFGSPCQDLSVAGKRAGLKHTENGDDETTRSGLFMEAVRIIKEMRDATNGVYPRFALWENVPGAFSSNKGEDFRIVLEELIKIVEPDAVMPAVPKNGWAYADSYCGDGWSIAYRVFDAQFWGVPQRRRRIYLVADFGGERAREVLFEREGLRGYFAESGTPWEGTAADAESGVGADDRDGECVKVFEWHSQALRVKEIKDSVSPTLSAGMGMGGANMTTPMLIQEPIAVATQQGGAEVSENGICPTITAAAGMSGNNQPWICSLEPGIAAREGGHVYEGVSGTLRANAGDNQMAVAYTMQDRAGKPGGGKGFLIQKDRATSLRTGNYQYVFQPTAYSFDPLASNSMKSKNPHSGCRQVDVSRTLDTTDPNPSKNQGGIAVVESLVLDDQGGQQISVREDGKSPTLRAEMHGNVPCVMEAAGFCPEESAKTRGVGYAEEQAPTLRAGAVPAVVYDARGNGDGYVCNTITGDHNNRITDYSSVVCCCIDGDKIGKAERAGGSGLGVREGDKMYTLTAKDAGQHAVAFQTYQKVTGPLMANSHPGSYTGQDAFSDMLVAGVEPVCGVTSGAQFTGKFAPQAETLRARDYKEPQMVCYGVDCRNATEYQELNGCLQAKPNGGFSANCNQIVRVRYIVRRPTPTECARLQGFADRWGDIEDKSEFSDEEYRFWLEVRNTHADINGKAVKDYTRQQMLNWYNKLQTDSSEYKMWGNGIALPTALYCMQGLAEALAYESRN